MRSGRSAPGTDQRDALLTPTEVVQLAEGLDPWFRPFVYTAVETGMRWSELVGLRRSAIDLLRYSIAVTEQLVYIGGDRHIGRPGRWVRQQPKTRAGGRALAAPTTTNWCARIQRALRGIPAHTRPDSLPGSHLGSATLLLTGFWCQRRRR